MRPRARCSRTTGADWEGQLLHPTRRSRWHALHEPANGPWQYALHAFAFVREGAVRVSVSPRRDRDGCVYADLVRVLSSPLAQDNLEGKVVVRVLRLVHDPQECHHARHLQAAAGRAWQTACSVCTTGTVAMVVAVSVVVTVAVAVAVTATVAGGHSPAAPAPASPPAPGPARCSISCAILCPPDRV